MTKIAHVKVPQGLGDIFWVYRKLFPVFDELHFYICILDQDDPVQKRSADLFTSLEKVKSVQTELVDKSVYRRVINGKFRLRHILKDYESGEIHFEYGCNRWLEIGRKLEDIDPESPPQWDLDLPLEKFSTAPDNPYNLLYVSGHTRHLGNEAWSIDQWVELVHGYYDELNLTLPVHLIGADYDVEVQQEIKEKLESVGLQGVSLYTSLPMPQLCWLIKHAEVFIGYQSGLNILADHLNTRQLMVYFNQLCKMTDTWVKPVNRVNGNFNHMLFKESPTKIGVPKLI